MRNYDFLNEKKLKMPESLRRVDELLATDALSPLQRQMLLNYQRHSRAENSGNWEQIFDPGMMVDDPLYILRFKNQRVEVRGTVALKEYYRKIAESSPVIYQHDQEIHLSATSFTTFSTSINFVTGQQILAMGEKCDDPEGFYARAKTALTFWPFDERGQLRGEFGGELGAATNIQIPERLFITPAEARETLTPLIRPLPAFEPGVEA
ncbi:hypothetical protein [Paraburkholderia sp. D1E]|uniref:hypothetical protein n=1 Tax=Paraburkholderia sp. D1E TaxID=3461398 RepID=UPI0040457BCE